MHSLRQETVLISSSLVGRFAGKTIDQLRQVAASVTDPGQKAALFEELKDEIRTRIERRGRARGPQQDFLKELEAGQVSPPSRRTAVADPEPPNDELDRLRTEVELWRSLYTRATESLVRWGLTSSVSPDVLEMVSEHWRKVLRNGPVDAVRTLDQLESDLVVARRLLSSGGEG